MNASPLRTTNASPTPLQEFAPAPDATVRRLLLAIEMLITAQNADGTSAVFHIRAAVKVVDSVSAVVGTPSVTSSKDAAASSWDATIEATAKGFRSVVTGDMGTPIVWCVESVELLTGQRGGAAWAA